MVVIFQIREIFCLVLRVRCKLQKICAPFLTEIVVISLTVVLINNRTSF